MRKSYFYAAIAIVFFGTLAPAVKLLVQGVGSFEFLCVASAFGGLALTAVCAYKKLGAKARAYSIKDYIKMIFMGSIGVFATNGLYYLGIETMKSQDACIINYLWPIMTIVFGCIILKEKITARKCAAALLAFFGVVLVATQGHIFTMQLTSVRGVVCCVLGAVGYGLYCVINKREHYDDTISMTVYMYTSAVMSAICVPIMDGFVPLDLVQTAGIAYVGIFPIAVGCMLWAKALKNGNTAKISILAYITPFLTLVFGYLILGEKVSLFSLAGLVVIVAGIAVQIFEKGEESAEETVLAEEGARERKAA